MNLRFYRLEKLKEYFLHKWKLKISLVFLYPLLLIIDSARSLNVDSCKFVKVTGFFGVTFLPIYFFICGSLCVGAFVASFVYKEKREILFGKFILYFVSVVCAVLAFSLSKVFETSARERTVDRGDKIVSAIARHKRETGRTPADLRELVPKYLDVLPSTGNCAYPEFRYSADENRNDFILRARYGVIGWDSLSYSTKERFPESSRYHGNWYYLID